MSYTTHASTATLTLANVNTDSDALNLLTDWLGNNPDEIPDGLSQDGTADELADELSPYIKVEEGGLVTVSLDTEGDGNYDSEVFDFITSHFCSIQSSEYMEVTWCSVDSRVGVSFATDYYDPDGNTIPVDEAIKSHKALDRIASILSGAEWDADRMMEVAEIVRGTGREVKDLG